MCGVNNDPTIQTLYGIEPLILKILLYSLSYRITGTNIYDYEWVVFNNLNFTILNKWIQQWFLYQHSRQTGFTNNLKSIILTELEDYRHQYLRLRMSGLQ